MKPNVAIVALLLFSLLSCGRQEQAVRIVGGNVAVSAAARESLSVPMRRLLVQGKAAIDSIKSPVVGYAAATLVAERPESPLMNFAADALLCRARLFTGEKIDVAITNKGGLRSELSEGVITFGDVYNVFPFENSIITLTLNGEQLLQLFGEVARVGGEAIGGARMEISRCGSNLSCKKVVVGGCLLPGVDDSWKESEFRVVTNNYLAQGNDGLSTLVQGYDRKEYGVTLRELVLDYISALYVRGRAVDAAVDGRVKVIECD
ncbi:MAG: 5'-nucleotidase C-terminal domain-containing protein [Bacteroidaceae bacterium]|nr:5'-nucleotidase C-terminal domain-containing protein [Bacteroidaceae bacterium]